MGIEENVERIANALELISASQTKVLAIYEWNKDRLSEKKDSVEAEPSDQQAPGAPAEQLPAHEWTYDELKAELTKRGVEVAKGTKMTTLLKFWELHKNDPEMQIQEPAEEENAAAPEEDIFSAPQEAAAEPVKKTPMTELDARDHIMAKGYTGTPEQRVVMKKALASVGKASFKDLVEGEYDKLIAEFDRLMEEK